MGEGNVCRKAALSNLVHRRHPKLSGFAPIERSRLSEISPEMVRAYIAKRQADGLNVTSINRESQIPRRILRLAVEWGATESIPKIRMLPGEKRRERVVTLEEGGALSGCSARAASVRRNCSF